MADSDAQCEPNGVRNSGGGTPGGILISCALSRISRSPTTGPRFPHRKNSDGRVVSDDVTALYRLAHQLFGFFVLRAFAHEADAVDENTVFMPYWSSVSSTFGVVSTRGPSSNVSRSS